MRLCVYLFVYFLRGTCFAERTTYYLLSRCLSVWMDELMCAWRLLINQKDKPLFREFFQSSCMIISLCTLSTHIYGVFT